MEKCGIRSSSYIALIMVASVAGMAFALGGPGQARPLEVVIEEEGIRLPEELPAGYYYVDIRSEGGSPPTELAVDRLKDAVTLEEAAEAYEAVNEQFATGGPAHEAIERLTQLIVGVGGYTEPPSAFELTPGEYMVGVTREDFSFSYQGLTVTEAQATRQEPEVDLTVDMMDFAFSVPDEVASGEQTWEVRNVGEQVHHMIMWHLAEGKTAEDLMTFMQSGEGEPPAQEIGWTAILSPGVSNYVTYDLQPGNYFVICFLPDYETGQPHFMLGMTDTFTVTGD